MGLIISVVENPPLYISCWRLIARLLLSLSSGPRRSASWTPSASWRPSWASASSSHSSASPRLSPSYLPLARLQQVVSSQQSCLKHEAKCCSKTERPPVGSRAQLECVFDNQSPNIPESFSAARHTPTEQDCHPHCKPRILWNTDCIIQSLYRATAIKEKSTQM